MLSNQKDKPKIAAFSKAEFLQNLHSGTSLVRPLFLMFCLGERPNHIGAATFVKISMYVRTKQLINDF